MKNKYDRQYKMAKKAAVDRAGGERAFAVIGSTFRIALVGQEILGLVYQQDESVSDFNVRYMLMELRDLLNADESLL